MKCILIPVDYYHPAFRYGGPITTLRSLVALMESSFSIDIITRGFDRSASDIYPLDVTVDKWVRNSNHSIFYARRFYVFHVLRHCLFFRYDIIYINSFFSPTSFLIYVLSFLRIISSSKVLIAPRGELTGGALSIKSRKKLLFLFLFKLFFPFHRYSWHVSNDLEAQEVLRYIPIATSRLFVAVDPVTLPSFDLTVPRLPRSVFRIVFASRISPKKNLDFLIKALMLLRQPCCFVVYGCIDDSAYWNYCLSLLNQLPSHISWEYRGEYLPTQLPDVFAESDLFAFPTLSENFGHVVYESLSHGCPVLISPFTPWSSSPPSVHVAPISSPSHWSAHLDNIIISSQSVRSSVYLSCISYSKDYFNRSRQNEQTLAMFNAF